MQGIFKIATHTEFLLILWMWYYVGSVFHTSYEAALYRILTEFKPCSLALVSVKKYSRGQNNWLLESRCHRLGLPNHVLPIASRDQLSTNHVLSFKSRDQLSTNHVLPITSRDQLSTNHVLPIISRDQLSTNDSAVESSGGRELICLDCVLSHHTSTIFGDWNYISLTEV